MPNTKPFRVEAGHYIYRGWTIRDISHRDGMTTLWRVGSPPSGHMFPTLRDCVAFVDGRAAS